MLCVFRSLSAEHHTFLPFHSSTAGKRSQHHFLTRRDFSLAKADSTYWGPKPLEQHPTATAAAAPPIRTSTYLVWGVNCWGSVIKEGITILAARGFCSPTRGGEDQYQFYLYAFGRKMPAALFGFVSLCVVNVSLICYYNFISGSAAYCILLL